MILRHALKTSTFFSLCNVFGKLDPLHITIGGCSFTDFFRNPWVPVSHFSAVGEVTEVGGLCTNGDNPASFIRSDNCSLVVGHPRPFDKSGMLIGDLAVSLLAIDEGAVEWTMGLSVGTGGEFFSS